MADSIIERRIEAAGQTCTAILSEGFPSGNWRVRVRLPDGTEGPVPGMFDTEGQAIIAATQRAAHMLNLRKG